MAAGHEISTLGVYRRYLSKSSEALSAPICGTSAIHSVYHEHEWIFELQGRQFDGAYAFNMPTARGAPGEETFCDKVT